MQTLALPFEVPCTINTYDYYHSNTWYSSLQGTSVFDSWICFCLAGQYRRLFVSNMFTGFVQHLAVPIRQHLPKQCIVCADPFFRLITCERVQTTTTNNAEQLFTPTHARAHVWYVSESGNARTRPVNTIRPDQRGSHATCIPHLDSREEQQWTGENNHYIAHYLGRSAHYCIYEVTLILEEVVIRVV